MTGGSARVVSGMTGENRFRDDVKNGFRKDGRKTARRRPAQAPHKSRRRHRVAAVRAGVPFVSAAAANVSSRVTSRMPWSAQTARCRASPARRPLWCWSASLAALRKLALVTGRTTRLCSTSRAKAARHSARCSDCICPVRSLSDCALENSVMTQSLMCSSPAPRAPSQF